MDKLLPREIEVDIFSRLPAETLIPCKRVCRTWRGVFNDEYFIDAHLRRHSNAGFGVEDDHSYFHKKRGSSRSSDSEEDAVNKGSSRSSNSEDVANSTKSKVSFLILGGSYVKGQNKSFYYGNYSDEKQEFNYKKIKSKKMNNHLFTPNSDYSLVGSCNGLICFSTSHFSEFFVSKDPVCVCNPITGEVLNLPRLIVDYEPIEVCFKVGIASGFGYVPFINEYKVVRICYYGTEAIGVEVYTLGSGNGWERCKGNIDCLIPSDLTASPGVYANGTLYWLNFKEEFGIVAFDLAKEGFYVMSAPSCFRRGNHHGYQLLVLGGWLTFVHQRRGKYVDIWMLDDSSLTRQSWCWRKECRIPWEGKWDSEYEPFAITERGHVLFWYNKTILSLYDPKARSVMKLMDGDDLGFKDFQAIPHTNSFVSLKALGKG